MEHGVDDALLTDDRLAESLCARNAFYVPTLRILCLAKTPETLPIGKQNLKKLSEKGVRIALGTDSVADLEGTPPGLNTIKEIANHTRPPRGGRSCGKKCPQRGMAAVLGRINGWSVIYRLELTRREQFQHLVLEHCPVLIDDVIEDADLDIFHVRLALGDAFHRNQGEQPQGIVRA